VALTVTVPGDDARRGAVYTPVELTRPTALLPPVTPFTFQITDVFGVPVTVAVNWRFCPMGTVALAGEMAMPTAAGAVTVTDTLFDTVPSLIVATTGTDPGDDAVPVAVSRIDDTKVVGSAVPPKDTTAPDVNPAPLTVSVNGPAGNDGGLTEVIDGSGTTVTAADPLAVGTATLVARTVTTLGLGTAAGAR